MSELTIKAYRLKDVKGLKNAEGEPKGNMIIVGGANGAGKSSLLDAIMFALGGKRLMPDEPIRAGAKKAEMFLDLGDITIERSVTEKSDRLVVKDSEGKSFSSPQAMLDTLVGRLSFDPISFVELRPAEQLETLRGIVGLDFGELDANRAALYEERTHVNRQVRDTDAESSSFTPHPDVPKEEQSSLAISESLSEAIAHNEKNASLRIAAESLTGQINTLDGDIKRTEELLADQRLRLAGLEAGRTEAQTKAAECKDVNVDAIRKQLEEVEAVNRAVRENAAHSALREKRADYQEETDRLTESIKEVDAEKVQLMQDADFPVEGLTLGDNAVLWNSVPFAQASTAEKLCVSVAIAAAANPSLKIMLIRRGSDLDEKSLALIERFAIEHDYQVWIERVGNDEKATIIVEAGEARELVPAKG